MVQYRIHILYPLDNSFWENSLFYSLTAKNCLKIGTSSEFENLLLFKKVGIALWDFILKNINLKALAIIKVSNGSNISNYNPSSGLETYFLVLKRFTSYISNRIVITSNSNTKPYDKCIGTWKITYNIYYNGKIQQTILSSHWSAKFDTCLCFKLFYKHHLIY